MKTSKMQWVGAWIILFFLPFALQAQLSVSSGYTATQLAEILTGSGVTITNATFINPGGVSAGVFSNGSTTNIGLDEGVLLTSGNINIAPGPNDQPNASYNTNAPGDTDLNGLIPSYTTYDACILEFDLASTGDHVTFRYVFASEEYEEYFCTSYNDVFAFFVDGPNPGGGNYNNYNIALIPGTTTPVSINNLGPGTCNGVNNSTYYNNNNGGATIQYDGFTDVLTAEIDLVRCQTYHFRLAIADAGDHILDSGVFLEAGSFNSNDILATADVTHPSCPGFSDGAIELTIAGGVGPYEILWDNGSIGEDLINIPQGGYSVIVTDADGCTETYDFTLTDIPDNEAPVMVCQDLVVITLHENGSSTILPQDLDDGSFDNCGIASYTASQTTFTCDDVGDLVVTLFITDLYGNMGACDISVIVKNPPNFVVDLGPYCVPVYYGYDPMACTEITATVTGGTPPYSYEWNGISGTSFIDVCPTTTTVFNLEVSDANGCTITASKMVEVVDVHCGNKGDKVLVCHVPPGEPENEHNICISPNAVPAHLAIGDYLGPCGYVPCSYMPINAQRVNSLDYLISVAPNPTRGAFTVFIREDAPSEPVQLMVLDASGREVFSTPWQPVRNEVEMDVYTPFPAGLYTLQIRFSNGERGAVRFAKF
jgi:hypothetical protein